MALTLSSRISRTPRDRAAWAPRERPARAESTARAHAYRAARRAAFAAAELPVRMLGVLPAVPRSVQRLTGTSLVDAPIHVLKLAVVAAGALWLLSRLVSTPAAAWEEEAFSSENPDEESDA